MLVLEIFKTTCPSAHYRFLAISGAAKTAVRQSVSLFEDFRIRAIEEVIILIFSHLLDLV